MPLVIRIPIAYRDGAARTPRRSPSPWRTSTWLRPSCGWPALSRVARRPIAGRWTAARCSALLRGNTSGWPDDRGLLLELNQSSGGGAGICTYQGVRLGDRVYTEYSSIADQATGTCQPDSERELYELGSDPYELEQPGRYAGARGRAGAAVQPPRPAPRLRRHRRARPARRTDGRFASDAAPHLFRAASLSRTDRASAALRCWRLSGWDWPRRTPRAATQPARAQPRSSRPNIVLIQSDDQTMRQFTRRVMPKTMRLLAAAWHQLHRLHRHDRAVLPLARIAAHRAVRPQPRSDLERRRLPGADRQAQRAARVAPAGGLPDHARRQVPERLRAVRRAGLPGCSRLDRLVHGSEAGDALLRLPLWESTATSATVGTSPRTTSLACWARTPCA